MPPTLDFTKARAEDGSATHRRITAQYNGPASYVTGGDSFRPVDVKLGAIELLLFEPVALDANNANPKVVDFDEDNNVVRWYELTTGLEVAAGTNLSGFDIRFEAIGH